MAKNQLEKQKEQLAKLNKQIKEEENKIAQRLGRAIITQSNLKFEHLTKDKISEIAKKVANEIKNINHHDDNFPPAYS
ncbi:hypothetical protein [Lactococcus lactis]|uniref:hypothetical protein n=1 Tax=Lactococcus lactis TaxID=1358 RepID=UPI0037C784EA